MTPPLLESQVVISGLTIGNVRILLYEQICNLVVIKDKHRRFVIELEISLFLSKCCVGNSGIPPQCLKRQPVHSRALKNLERTQLCCLSLFIQFFFDKPVTVRKNLKNQKVFFLKSIWILINHH